MKFKNLRVGFGSDKFDDAVLIANEFTDILREGAQHGGVIDDEYVAMAIQQYADQNMQKSKANYNQTVYAYINGDFYKKLNMIGEVHVIHVVEIP